MSLLGNIVWMIFGGFITGMGYILGGLIICVTIVGIPFGVQAMKLGVATMTPFGRQILPNERAGKPGVIVLNIIWAILFGWEIAIAHLIHGLILYITIIGIPFGNQHFKLIPLALAPFGRDLR
ncbi:MAG: YccF domain-containing protein [Gammaproteobacteria bacterium]|nr:YccF domain-containing protein [Gammaproteobacteria bacterium]